ncbi:MAG: cardiolipin synthase [Anaerosolibacter sp.]|uniref:cardiolipin synthase n=1 Tax=Anaerosolibacter sp. TaxID=1872527 RepID=UPI002634BD85|nr:cardiolipin synthase [Anaerosolibacter sp.]MDF2547230.1 cardiolipin synthase [Anaerosolibacter sp.]
MKRLILLVLVLNITFTLMRYISIRWLIHALLMGLILLAIITLTKDIQRDYHGNIARKGQKYIELLSEQSVNKEAITAKSILGKRYSFPEKFNDSTLDMNHIELLENEEKFYKAVFETIKKAKKHIHIEYFILKDDVIGTKFKELLIQKRREGVEVRLLYDGLGTLLIKPKYIQQLQKEGIETAAFSPIWEGVYHLSINHRNHRKLLVVDGKTCITGGRNIADEYFGEKTEIGEWKDIDILIEGTSTKQLQIIFLRDWYVATGKALTDKVYFAVGEHAGQVPMQIVTGGPDSPQNNIEHTYFSLINKAEKQIHIITPYFIPSESIVIAIENAVLRGVDVEILIPIDSDNVVAKYATNIWGKRLTKSGVKVYKFTGGFTHNKMITVDGHVASVGTANFDYRGMQRDYEILCIIYDMGYTERLIEIFNGYLSRAYKVEVQGEESLIHLAGMQLIKMIRGSL